MARLNEGQKVHYDDGFKKENGIVKEVREDIAFVVFHCAGEWNNFREYTGQSTSLEDLHEGWVLDRGRITQFGHVAGDQCNRSNCVGIIEEHEKEGGCRCHCGNPPCSYCTQDTAFCPVCDHEAGDDIYFEPKQ